MEVLWPGMLTGGVFDIGTCFFFFSLIKKKSFRGIGRLTCRICGIFEGIIDRHESSSDAW